MSTIEFKDLNKSIGTELFTDTESFLEDLGDDAANIVGGTSNLKKIPYGPVTTHYRPTEHDLHPIRYSTIVLHQPQLVPPLRLPHPVRHPRPVHPVAATNI